MKTMARLIRVLDARNLELTKYWSVAQSYSLVLRITDFRWCVYVHVCEHACWKGLNSGPLTCKASILN